MADAVYKARRPFPTHRAHSKGVSFLNGFCRRSPRRLWHTLSKGVPPFFLLGLLLTAVGCGGGGGSPGPGPGTEPPPVQEGWNRVTRYTVPPQKKWTFLVFLNGVSNLDPYAGLNMNQMEAVGSTDDVNIVVQVKKFNSPRYDPDFPDWKDTGTRRFLIRKDNNRNRISSEVLEQNNTVDMGKADALRKFIDWGVAAFPAERYALVIWNHGAGWRSVKGRGVSYDDLTGSHIDTIQLPDAVRLNGRKWDLLAFDASLMQMAEVAYEIRNEARYIAGSEESPPGEGYPYDRFLAKLVQNPNMDGREFGAHIVRDTIASYGESSSITHSLLDAAKLEGVAASVNRLGDALRSATAQHGSAIAAARSDAEEYQYPENHDLLHFTELLIGRVNDGGVQAAARDVQSAVGASLVVNVNGSGHPNSRGLAIFLPSPARYRSIDLDQADGVGPLFGNRYIDLAFAKAAPNWQSFLVQGPP